MDPNVEWLSKRVEHHLSKANTMCEANKDFEDLDKLGQGFTSAKPLVEVDMGDGSSPRLTFVNKNLEDDYKVELIIC